jgi:prevent-host-death family protein
MKGVKISELKARLSAYLAGVRRGRTVVVLDRSTPIARIVPYEEELDDFRVEQPARPDDDLRKLRGARPKRRIDVVGLLREDRDAR